jgi:dinuclear metal center YbgI/SA1388 family protein
MGLSAQTLENHLNQLLKPEQFKDYCPNGLQVDAGQPITHLVTGVTASLELIEAAADIGAQGILVHHGYFWKGEDERLIGMKGARIRALIKSGVSLFAYHLPLDAHPSLGNNAQLASDLGLEITGPMFKGEKNPIAVMATPQSSISNLQMADRICQVLGRKPQHIGEGFERELNLIGLCTGAAQDWIDQAALRGCDLYISGEISERTVLSARELDIDYMAAGHHATERGGVRALGAQIASDLGLKVSFIDIENPA